MTSADIETVAARVYELATVENLPPDSAKRHIAEVLRQLIAVPYEEAARLADAYADDSGGYVEMRVQGAAEGIAEDIRALKDSLQPEPASA